MSEENRRKEIGFICRKYGVVSLSHFLRKVEDSNKRTSSRSGKKNSHAKLATKKIGLIFNGVEGELNSKKKNEKYFVEEEKDVSLASHRS